MIINDPNKKNNSFNSNDSIIKSLLEHKRFLEDVSKEDDYRYSSSKKINGGNYKQEEIINRIGMMLGDDWGGRGKYKSEISSDFTEGVMDNKNFFNKEVSDWFTSENLIKSLLQDTLMKKEGYPEGNYGLYDSFYESESNVNDKYRRNARETTGTIFRDEDSILSLLMPEVKVKPYSKTSKGYNINPMKIKY